MPNRGLSTHLPINFEINGDRNREESSYKGSAEMDTPDSIEASIKEWVLVEYIAKFYPGIVKENKETAFKIQKTAFTR